MFLPGVRSSGSEKGAGRTLVRQVRRKERAEPWLGRFGVQRKEQAEPWFGRFGVRRKERAEPWFGRFGVRRKERAEPWFGRFGERNGPNPGSAGSEKGAAEPWFGRFGARKKGTGLTLVRQVRSSEKKKSSKTGHYQIFYFRPHLIKFAFAPP